MHRAHHKKAPNLMKWKLACSIASYDREIDAEQAEIKVAERDSWGWAGNQRLDKWWKDFLKRVEAWTCECSLKDHFDWCAKSRNTNYKVPFWEANLRKVALSINLTGSCQYWPLDLDYRQAFPNPAIEYSTAS